MSFLGRQGKGPLTAAQQEVYDFCVQYLKEHGCMPTTRAIGVALGFSGPNGIFEHLRRLEARGYLRRDGEAGRLVLACGSPCPTCFGTGRVGELPVEAEPLHGSLASSPRTRGKALASVDAATRALFLERAPTGERDACWPWPTRHPGDYGAFTVGRTSHPATRVAYVIHKGPVAAGEVVRHKCDNPPCVNPEHLELGTHRDNMDDMVARGRAGSGRRRLMKKAQEAA